jgi:hypothetical protein
MLHAVIGCVLAGFVLLTGCNLPNRVKQDNSIETIKYFVEERLIVPFSASVMRSIFLPEKQPHRQLLQVHYHEKSFYQDGVLKFLNRLKEQETITKNDLNRTVRIHRSLFAFSR